MAVAMALVVEVAVGESFEEVPECASRMKRIDVEHSAVERVPIPDQIVEHVSGNAR